MFSRAALPFAMIVLGVALYATGSVGRFVVAGCLVLFAPGYLIWSVLRPTIHLPRLAVWSLWLGLSLSLIPIMFLWSSTLGLRLMPAVLKLQAVGIGLLAAWQWQRSVTARRVPHWLWLSLLGLLGLVGLTRWSEIRGIALPLWVDSLHHTLLIRIVGETGRIPTSLQPYLPVDRLIYHWGYHVVAATWREIADLPLAPAVLWTGQALNALIALVMYALGAYFSRSPLAGLMAAGVAGLLSLMPAYYVTWGRYTQLAGLLLLPNLLIASVALAERRTFSWRLSGLTALLLAGLMLVHYRVLVFYAAFMAPYAALLIARRPRQMVLLLLHFAGVSVLATLLVAPWVLEMLQRVLLRVANDPSLLVGSDSYNSIDWTLVTYGNHNLLYLVAVVGGMIALWRRHWRIVAVAGWIGMLLLLANPEPLGLPPSWFINNHSVIITLFMPVSVLAGFAAARIVRWLRRSGFPELQLIPLGALLVYLLDQALQSWQRVSLLNLLKTPRELLDAQIANPLFRGILQSTLVALVVVALGVVVAYVLAYILRLIGREAGARSTALIALTGVALLGAWQLRAVVNPATALATAADVKALAWIDVNTPPDAHFLVNTTPWLNGSYRGADAGWWILPLTGRWVSTPPALYIYGGTAYKQAVEALNQRVSQLRPGNTDQLSQIIRDQRITYVYVGGTGGGTLKGDLLASDPNLNPVYDSDGVTIFAVRQQP